MTESASSIDGTVVVARRGPGELTRWIQGMRRGALDRRFAGGESSAMSRSSRTRASISVAVSMTRTPAVVSTMRAIVVRLSAAVK
jgi:hypothetical protein